MDIIEIINAVIGIVFFACYFYQFVYIAVPFLKKDKPHKPTVMHRFAVLISARNEEAVIGQLIKSVLEQDYSQELVDIFVVADNCTDATAQICRNLGARVYERTDTEHVGKGYALNFLLKNIEQDYPEKYDAFMVFDADNVIEKNYITEINRTYSDGHQVVTGYRNSKNYASNWISAGYALWFMRESRQLNHARMLLGTSCTVSGTGFMFSREIYKKAGGWNFFLLTEDLEFSAWLIINGEKVAYCKDAVLYDEQPTQFRQSWRQRMRWSRGFLQIVRKYGKGLLRSIFSPRFMSAYDISMTLMPAYLLTVTATAVNSASLVLRIVSGSFDVAQILLGLLGLVQGAYSVMFVIGLIATVTEWKKIHCSAYKKILYVFTFPLFMITYVPISIAALFSKVEWKPILHTQSKSLDDIINT